MRSHYSRPATTIAALALASAMGALAVAGPGLAAPPVKPGEARASATAQAAAPEAAGSSQPAAVSEPRGAPSEMSASRKVRIVYVGPITAR
ncbi:MAG TPA: hypothetical protein VIL65_09995 [Beijerinckiaceae bacterium]|jgi:hypothetical protein